MRTDRARRLDQRDEDGIVVVLLMEAPALDLRDTVREALAACPAAAIQLAES